MMRTKNKITKKEIKNRAIYLLLALFTWFLISPIYNFFVGELSIDTSTQMLIGGFGILTILYFFKT